MTKWKSNDFLYVKLRTRLDTIRRILRIMKFYSVGNAKYVDSISSLPFSQPPQEYNIEYRYIHIPPCVIFSQSKKENSQQYVCACMKKAINNFVELQVRFGNFMGTSTPLDYHFFSREIALSSVGNISDPIATINFKEKICPRCQGVIVAPNEILFRCYVEIYILEKGISFFHRKYLDNCPEEFKRIIDKNNEVNSYFREKLIKPGYRTNELYNLLTEEEKNTYKKQRISFNKFRKTFENDIRAMFGYKSIGEGLVSETKLFKILDRIFLENYSIKHYRPGILEGLEIDYYLPELKIGIEYQGEQHFQPVEYFGGKEAFEKQKDRDMRKKNLCKRNGILLVYINYSDVLNESNVRNIITSQIDNIGNLEI